MSRYGELTDDELALLMKNGDQIAYTEIYNRYHGKLFIHVFHKIHSREDSRDIIHDLFSSLWSKRQDLMLKSTLSAYLYSAARYSVFDFIAHRQVERKYYDSLATFIDKGECLTDHMLRERELQDQIDREISALPQKMRAVFNLSRKENLSHLQIADQLQLSVQTVKKQVQNALKVLKTKLGTLFF